MPYVHGPTPPSGAEGVSERLVRPEPAAKTDPVQGQDRVEISEVARWKAKLAEIPAVRETLVAAIRAEIEAGSYETEDKIRIAAERLLAELREEGAL
ncbi:MAG TPA: flagellar biosynthesis anti-sigma factor FlgM [Planctomycetota bacterium]|jgi:anti-sigma28 factor (negative regulator of flagellin synthesis)|nr:flagellar biosynthesis anti-sigma factor FlgM [Planctomycetota bacterium]OQC21613.1 MAG: hypothetical protein BWX69_00826 [Planctomycetes bacterium ADurb.Bin069]HPY68504.1 flagellar biosynthesis anti-sigma factor FlgM [Planctomycetota bacterium]